MFKFLKATAAAALLALGIAAADTTPANAFVPVSPDAIATGANLTTNVSCGGIDCDAPSQRGYTFYGRYHAEPRYRGGRRYRSYRRDEFRGYRSRRWQHRQVRRGRKWKQRRVRRAVRNLVDAFAGGRW